MKISDAGLAIIKDFEGYEKPLHDGRCEAYQCLVGHDARGRPVYDGKWTIGWGCTEGITPGMIWTREQAEAGLRREVEKSEREVARVVKVSINQNQADALISFDYNIGDGGLESSTVLRCVNKGDTIGAAHAFAAWNKSQGHVVPGLVSRRAREAALFLKPAAVEPTIASTQVAVGAVNGGAGAALVAGPAMPQAIDRPSEPTPNQEAHEDLKQESWTYSGMNWLRKKLGLPAAGGTLGIASMDDPIGTVGQAIAFVRDHGLAIVGCAVILIVAVEAWQWHGRYKAINGSA